MLQAYRIIHQTIIRSFLNYHHANIKQTEHENTSNKLKGKKPDLHKACLTALLHMPSGCGQVVCAIWKVNSNEVNCG